MTLSDFEAPRHEAPRRIFGELPDDLVQDMERYDLLRAEKERDVHIAYARSAAQQIRDGLPVHIAIQYMKVEIPANNFDRKQLIDFINHLLDEFDVNIRFDTSLNAFTDAEVVSSGDAETVLSVYEHEREGQQLQLCRSVAERVGERLLGGFSFDIIMTFAKADIVSEGMNAAVVARCLNEYLESRGSDLRVDTYLRRAS